MEKQNDNVQFLNFDKLFELESIVDLRKMDIHSMNIRIPKSMNKIMEADIEAIKKKCGIRLSKNDYMVLMLMVVMNVSQHKEEGHVYRNPNYSSLTNYIDKNRDALVSGIKERLFKKQFDLAISSTATNRKEKNAQIMRQKRLEEQIQGLED